MRLKPVIEGKKVQGAKNLLKFNGVGKQQILLRGAAYLYVCKFSERETFYNLELIYINYQRRIWLNHAIKFKKT